MAAGRRPLVGVTASARGSRMLWLFNRLALIRAGARAVKLTADAVGNLDRLDALVIGGGDDIEPVRYGAALEPTVKIDPARDELELEALDWAARRSRPVLGICRGAQMINVHRGGTLHVDIYKVYVEAPRLRTVLPRKIVRVDPDSRLSRVLRQEECRVNALHHQSIDRLGQGLCVAARDVHGIVQAVEATDSPFVLGVQWHPEFLVTDKGQQRLYGALVAAVAGRTLEEQAGAPA